MDVGELEDMRRLEKIPTSVVKYDKKFEYTGVSISVLPILRLSLSVQERGLVIGMYRYRDLLSLVQIPRQPRYQYYWGLDIRTRPQYTNKGRGFEGLPFGLFLNCLPEIKWFGHLAIFEC